MKEYCEHRAIDTLVGGKQTVIRGLRKRLRPQVCELCLNKEPTAYHHWDNSDPSVGLWLCFRCHMAVEVIEHFPRANLCPTYCKLKNKAVVEVIAERRKTTGEVEALRRRWETAREAVEGVV